MKLLLSPQTRYRVKKGQTLAAIAEAFRLPPRALAALNCLKEEPEEGEILFLPEETGNLYTVRGGESKTLLCGSREKFREKNHTDCFYPGQRILL